MFLLEKLEHYLKIYVKSRTIASEFIKKCGMKFRGYVENNEVIHRSYAHF